MRARNSFSKLQGLLYSTLNISSSPHFEIAPSRMVPGVYWAEMSSSPFLENPLEGRSAKLEIKSQIVGILGYGDSGKPGP